MSEIKIRQTRQEDRAAVLAFCAQTWKWGDYIEQVWDTWLQDQAGQFLVALSDDQPVGIIHLRMLNVTEAWHEGMRIDPAYRRQGIARLLSNEATAEAMRRGAKTVRLMTSSRNEASIHLIESMKFRCAGVWAPYTASPVTSIPRSNTSKDALVLAQPEDANEIIDYLNLSNLFPATGGLYYTGYVGYRISNKIVHEKIQAGQIYLLHRWERLDGLAIAETHTIAQKKRLSIGYIDGTTESISLIAYMLRHKLVELSLEEVFANVPDLMMVRDAFVGAEYEWAGELFSTYEKDLV